MSDEYLKTKTVLLEEWNKMWKDFESLKTQHTAALDECGEKLTEMRTRLIAITCVAEDALKSVKELQECLCNGSAMTLGMAMRAGDVEERFKKLTAKEAK